MSGNNGGIAGGPCGACKFLRRKCVTGCIFAPYFDSEQGSIHFAAVHKVFGASNVSKLLLHIPAHQRLDAVVTICYEAQARLRDPVYGCVAHILALQRQVVNLQAELAYMQGHIPTLDLPLPTSPPPPPPPVLPLSFSDIPCSPNFVKEGFNLSTFFEPWSQQEVVQQRNTGWDSACYNNGDGELRELPRELFTRHVSTGDPSN